MDPTPIRIRSLVFLISGLLDLFFGSFLLLAWLNLIPIDLTSFGLSRNLTGLLGAGLAISGVVVVVYQVTRLKEPDE
jgi:hypothetical protein